MKLPTLISLVFLTTIPFSSLAAQQVNQQQANNLIKLGVVTISNQPGSPDDAVKVLDEKATKAGATYFRIIGLNTPSDSSHWRGVAEIYR